MSITRTKNLKLINADKGDDIPAGTKADAATPVNDLNNSGRNGDQQKIDEAVGQEHNADGTHKNNVIKGVNCIQTGADAVVDESSLEFSSNKMQIKALGVGTPELAANGVTVAKIEDAYLAAGRQIYGAPTEAAVASGNIAANATEWTEGGSSPLVKIRLHTVKRSRDTKIKLICRAKTSGGTWYVRVYFNAVGTYTEKSGTNTAFLGTTPEVDISLDITGLADDEVHQCGVELHTSGGVTATMKEVVLMISQD